MLEVKHGCGLDVGNVQENRLLEQLVFIVWRLENRNRNPTSLLQRGLGFKDVGCWVSGNLGIGLQAQEFTLRGLGFRGFG